MQGGSASRVAILGASSRIASDLVVHWLRAGAPHDLFLYARQPERVTEWLRLQGISGGAAIRELGRFGEDRYDAVLNFVGAGDPARLVAMGATIFDVTAQYDQLALDYLRRESECRYLFMSSGAAYGGHFTQPATRDTAASFDLNNLRPQEWYGAAKFHAECRHRALSHLAVFDVRIFSYFSRNIDLQSRFMLSDAVRAIRSASILEVDRRVATRDYIHPSDFTALMDCLLSVRGANAALDCYSCAPVEKQALLEALRSRYGLESRASSDAEVVEATGSKPNYYSVNDRASEFGYTPTRTSLDGIFEEVDAILGKAGR